MNAFECFVYSPFPDVYEKSNLSADIVDILGRRQVVVCVTSREFTSLSAWSVITLSRKLNALMSKILYQFIGDYASAHVSLYRATFCLFIQCFLLIRTFYLQEA